jgi:pyruvate dehydrogenase E2 component (dihydrolipoamide acetyltransferase)
MTEIVMPRLSDSMVEGTITNWLKEHGQYVEVGEALVEVETDKATMEYEADAAGYLHTIASEGATVPIGQVIAQLLAEPVSNNAPRPEDPPPTAPRRRPISPVARRMAAAHDLELDGNVTGTGPGGRVIRTDVERLLALRAPMPPPPRAATSSASELVPATRTQQLIARRMAESKATAPEFSLRTEVEMDAATALRRQLRAAAERFGGPVPSYNDLVVKACTIALREFPRVNGSYRDAAFEIHSQVNIGFAVTAPDTLVVPTIADADQKSLREIALESRRLAERARSGEITPPELAGGTFTISNLGMYGVTEFVAVINPRQAAILAVGKIEERPVIRSGEFVAREMMNVTLVGDHRILYGAEAALFLDSLKALLEQPIVLTY